MTDGTSPTTTSVGAALRTARETAGRSLEWVAEATRIRAGLLQDLEQDRFDRCGGAVYARGHIRAVAHALGVDAAPLVELYDQQSGTAPPAHVDVPPVPLPRKPASALHVPLPAPPERRSPRWAQAGIATLVVLLGLFLLGTTGGDSEVAADPEPVAASASPAASPSPSPAARAPARPRPSGAVLGIRATGRTWLGVSAGGRLLFEGTVEAGWARTFNHPEAVRLRVGNAGGVRVSCGGGTGTPPGAVGAVVTVRCGPQGLLRP